MPPWILMQPPARVSLLPLRVESDTTEAGEDDPYPLGSFPCTNCQAIVAKGMLFCLRCKAPQSDESSKVTKKFFENKGLRLRPSRNGSSWGTEASREPYQRRLPPAQRLHKEARANVGRGNGHQRCQGSCDKGNKAQFLERGIQMDTGRTVPEAHDVGGSLL